LHTLHPVSLIHPNTFFLLMSRPPPRSTLFPYTTLFRSHERESGRLARRRPCRSSGAAARRPHASSKRTFSKPGRRRMKSSTLRRSEEHTSELQSLAYLVCRLLLEKKKKKKNKNKRK